MKPNLIGYFAHGPRTRAEDSRPWTHMEAMCNVGNVIRPRDWINLWLHNDDGHPPLDCNGYYTKVAVNHCCLLDDLETPVTSPVTGPRDDSTHEGPTSGRPSRGPTSS